MVDLQVIERKTRRITKLERENAQLGDKLSEQKLLSQKLQTALLMRHKETDACLQANEKLATELKQSKAKLANRGSKLGAVTFIAEATAVINSMARQSLDDRQAILHKRARQNLIASNRELEKENYEGAFFLCRKAMEQVRSIDVDKDTVKARPAEEEISFSTPLEMELFTTGNLRSAPSIKADIKTVLPEGSRVTAIGFQRNWVKVKSMDPLETGWIHLSLLY
ncbi:SH3 domain-containing protein [Desulfospira joergensenii]|uniref:SH3 domain-containing protein n=1 Tax=Desulfospira joergensenii TaxID=53329 RepID=UPI001FC8EE7E|nr:SH3 domain-containing protein [Desulfospira joergensenii]